MLENLHRTRKEDEEFIAICNPNADKHNLNSNLSEDVKRLARDIKHCIFQDDYTSHWMVIGKLEEEKGR